MNILTTLITYTVFLPTVFSPVDTNQRLGAYWWSGSYISSPYVTNGQWLKTDVPWYVIEENPNVYNWPIMLDANIEMAHRNGMPILLNFHNSPEWARDTSTPCTLPNYHSVDDFIEFISLAIDRYNPNAVEIWNEPESLASFSQTAGWCCGCVEDPQEYTNVLNSVYSAIKSKYPNITIIGGALTQDYLDTWAREWLLTNPSMDAVSFHYYQYYSIVSLNTSTDNLKSKITQLKSMTDKPIWLTETSFLCYTDILCLESFRDQQGYWLNNVYQVPGLEKIFWFSQNEVWWRKCNMLDERTDIVYPVFINFTHLVENECVLCAPRLLVDKK